MNHIRIYLCALVVALSLGCQDDVAPRVNVQDAVMEEPDTSFDPDEGAPPLDMAAPVLPDMGPPRDAATRPVSIERIDTSIGTNTSAAGTSTQVTCTVYDSDGEVMDGVSTQVMITPRQGWAFDDQDNTLYAHTTGEYTVGCVVARAAIADDTPETWSITPGAIALTVATAVPSRVAAGDRSQIGCAAYDVLNNEVNADGLAPSLVGDPADTDLDERRFRSTRAGDYAVICPADGATTQAANINVSPGAPQILLASLDPARNLYQAGAVVTVVTRATDVFGNTLAAPDVRLTTEPPLPQFGPDRFQLNRDGRFTITAALYLEDDTSVDTVDLPVVVDSGGPSLNCLSPAPNAMVRTSDDINLTGRATDAAAIGFVDIDGVPVQLAEDGSFNWPVNTRPGVNVHTVSATDEFGNTSEIFCPYFAADSYLPEGRVLNDGIILDLRTLAVDDGAPAAPLQSLADLFRLVIESDALIGTLNEAALAANPILPSQCVQDSFLGCLFRAGANFRNLNIRGPRTMSLGLIQGGFEITARFENARLSVDINGTLSTNGSIDVSFIEVSGRFALSLFNGVPQVLLVNNSDRLTIGALSSDFDGAAGFLLDLLFPLIESTIRDEVGDTLRGFIFDELDSILSSALGGLDLSSFGAGFDIEAPGGDVVRVSLATSTTTMNADPNRLRIGVGTRATGPQGHARPSQGVPVFGDVNAIERPGGGTLGAIIHLAVVNQLLHTLWRAGFFEIADAGAIAGDAADGFQFSFNLLVPPAMEGTNDGETVRVHLGPAQALLSYPGLIDEPISLMVAAILTLDVSLVDGNLSFGAEGIEFEELNLLIEDVAMEPEDRAAIEDTFGALVRTLVDSALGGALPSLPVPEIPIPADLADLGIPPGVTLGIRDPQLELTPARLFLDGDLRQ